MKRQMIDSNKYSKIVNPLFQNPTASESQRPSYSETNLLITRTDRGVIKQIINLH